MSDEPVMDAMPGCNPHPDAPHGFDRNGSHNEDRYVCDCEHWSPPDDYCYMAMRVDQLTAEEASRGIKGLLAQLDESEISHSVSVQIWTRPGEFMFTAGEHPGVEDMMREGWSRCYPPVNDPIWTNGCFEGHRNRGCGEHRTTGDRAWCFECTEWCYPDDGCVRCRHPNE